MLTENMPPLTFQVFINGIPQGSPLPTRMMAEMLAHSLSPNTQHLVEIRPITSTGKQMLFG